MGVEIKKLPKSRTEIKIKLSGEEFSPYLNIGAREISKTLNVPGFRLGKAPFKIVEEKVGWGRILDEAAKIALDQTFYQIIKEKKLEVLEKPEAKVQKLSKEGLEATVEVSFLPVVQLPLWWKIVKAEPKNKIEVKENEVEESLKYLQKSRAKFIRKSKAAQKGDLIQIDYEIRRGGVKIENGDIKNQKFILGEGKFLPGFEENLVGAKDNEEKEFSLNVPADFWKRDLRQTILDFKVGIKGVFKVELPQTNDEWVRTLGKFDNLSHLKNSLREGIKIEKEEAERKRWENKVLEKISQEAKIDLPDVLVEKERNQMIKNFKTRVEEMGISFEDYLSQLKKPLKDLEKDFLPEAEKRVRILLSLYQIAKEEKINVNEEEVKEEISEILKKYPTITRDLEDKEKEVNLKAYLRENILQRKVIRLLVLKAR